MPGEQQGHEFVAYLVVGHGPALVVAGEQESGQDVATLLQARRVTPLPDLRIQRGIERIPGPDESRPRGVRPEAAISRGEQHERIAADTGDREDEAAQLVTPFG